MSASSPSSSAPVRPPRESDVVRRQALSLATLDQRFASSSKAGPSSARPGATKLGAPSTSAPSKNAGTSATNGAGTSAQGAEEEDEATLQESVERAHKIIDDEIRTLIDGFRDLLTLASITDKDVYRVAQENFEAEVRADMMVRAAQSLSLLSNSLRMSLLLSITPGVQRPTSASVEGGQGNDDAEDEEGEGEMEDVSMDAADAAQGEAKPGLVGATASPANAGTDGAQDSDEEALRLILETEQFRERCAVLVARILAIAEPVLGQEEEEGDGEKGKGDSAEESKAQEVVPEPAIALPAAPGGEGKSAAPDELMNAGPDAATNTLPGAGTAAETSSADAAESTATATNAMVDTAAPIGGSDTPAQATGTIAPEASTAAGEASSALPTAEEPQSAPQQAGEADGAPSAAGPSEGAGDAAPLAQGEASISEVQGDAAAVMAEGEEEGDEEMEDLSLDP